MKKTWNVISNIAVGLFAVTAVCMMIFTIFSVNTFDRNDRSLFGYKMYIVLSDSMSATDFDAGDLILVKETDPGTLVSGDIIAYISRAEENYGQTVAHKIRKLTTDDVGNPGFITYGTTTGIDDAIVVVWQDVLGQYRIRVPKVGIFFSFLKTVPGYLLLVLLPFLLLIIWQVVNCVRAFREYRAEQMADIQSEREMLREERENHLRMMKELEEMRQQITSMVQEKEWPEGVEQILSEELEEISRGDPGEWQEKYMTNKGVRRNVVSGDY